MTNDTIIRGFGVNEFLSEVNFYLRSHIKIIEGHFWLNFGLAVSSNLSSIVCSKFMTFFLAKKEWFAYLCI